MSLLQRLRGVDPRAVALSAVRGLRAAALPVAFGALVYMVALLVVFPYQRVGDYVEAIASTADLDLEVGDVGPILGIGVALRDLKLTSRPPAGAKPSRVIIDELRVTTRPLRNLTGGLAYRVRGEVFSGSLDLSVDADATAGSGRIDAQSIDLAELPGVAAALGLPVKGRLTLEAAVTIPELKLREAEGELRVACAGCEIGDGKARLKVEGNPLLAEGVVVPRLRLGELQGKIVFEDGVGRLQDVRSKSPDGELLVDGEVRLSDPAMASRIDLYVRFKVSDELLQSSDKIALMLQFAEGEGKRDDGFFGVRLHGVLRALSPPQWLKTAPPPSPAAPRAGKLRPPRAPGRPEAP